jgi:hypothetical protein
LALSAHADLTAPAYPFIALFLFFLNPVTECYPEFPDQLFLQMGYDSSKNGFNIFVTWNIEGNYRPELMHYPILTILRFPGSQPVSFASSHLARLEQEEYVAQQIHQKSVH